MLAKKRSPAIKKGRPLTPKGGKQTKADPVGKPPKSLRDILGWDKTKQTRRGSPFRPSRKP